MKRLLVAISLPLFLIACSGEKGTVNGESLSNVGENTPLIGETHAPLSILIFGGTSGIGLETTKLALSRGHQVTSITRHPERMAIEHANLINLKGDITKPDSYQSLFEGKDVIISSIGLGPSRKKVTVYSEGMKSVLIAMDQVEIKRVLTISGIGAGDSKGHGGFFYDRILNPLLLKQDYADKNRQEAILKDSDSDWTIVRPGFLTDDESEKNYRVIQNMDGIISGDITRSDVAHYLLTAIEQGNNIGETVFLSN